MGVEILNKPNVALFYPCFLGGGAESVCLWMLEALKETYNVTLFTVAGVDFAQLNAMYGTHLSPETVSVRSLYRQSDRGFWNFLIANSNVARMLLFHRLIRWMKTQKQDFDVMASAYNAVDLGCEGIQYIHWVKVLEGNAFYRKISDFSIERMKANLSIANSYTVAKEIEKVYGTPSTVVYPPVVLDLQEQPWTEKENAFICSGRITEAKQPHKAIEILSEVRKRGFDIKLYLTGGGGGAYALKYERFVKKLAQANADWVTLYDNLSYSDYLKVLSKCKYGIHYKKEPFGISIAEMVKAGTIPFVRSQGGQIEIVGAANHEILFDRPDEAADKIVNVLSSQEQQQALLLKLNDRRSLFSTERFMSDICQVFANYLERQS